MPRSTYSTHTKESAELIYFSGLTKWQKRQNIMKQAQYRAKRKAAKVSAKRESECFQDFYMQSYVENSVFQSCCFSHGETSKGRIRALANHRAEC